jgi:hypothetical protein
MYYPSAYKNSEVFVNPKRTSAISSKKSVLSFFFGFLPKCRSTAFYAPTIDRSDISTGDRAH